MRDGADSSVVDRVAVYRLVGVGRRAPADPARRRRGAVGRRRSAGRAHAADAVRAERAPGGQRAARPEAGARAARRARADSLVVVGARRARRAAHRARDLVVASPPAPRGAAATGDPFADAEAAFERIERLRPARGGRARPARGAHDRCRCDATSPARHASASLAHTSGELLARDARRRRRSRSIGCAACSTRSDLVKFAAAPLTPSARARWAMRRRAIVREEHDARAAAAEPADAAGGRMIELGALQFASPWWLLLLLLLPIWWLLARAPHAAGDRLLARRGAGARAARRRGLARTLARAAQPRARERRSSRSRGRAPARTPMTSTSRGDQHRHRVRHLELDARRRTSSRRTGSRWRASEIKQFVTARSSDRIGIVAFSGEALTQVPLTTDYPVVQAALDNLQPGQLEDGTAIGTAIATAANRLRDAPGNSRVMILLTDGVNNRGSIDPRTAAKAAAAVRHQDLRHRRRHRRDGAGARGARPVRAALRDADGARSTTRCSPTSRTRRAGATSARAIRPRSSASPSRSTRSSATPVRSRTYVRYTELFRWPLCADARRARAGAAARSRGRGRCHDAD